MSNEQKDIKNVLTAKKLPCGGYAVYGIDMKTKNTAQVGYVGKTLAEFPYYFEGVKVEK
jgi:hypothetical protein